MTGLAPPPDVDLELRRPARERPNAAALRFAGCRITPRPGRASEETRMRTLADCRARDLFVRSDIDLPLALAGQAPPELAGLTAVAKVCELQA